MNAISTESILHSAMSEIDDAIRFGSTRNDKRAKRIVMEARSQRKWINESLTACFYTDRKQPDASKALTALIRAAHLSEKARQNYAKDLAE